MTFLILNAMKQLILIPLLFLAGAIPLYGQINYIEEGDKLFEQGNYAEAQKKYQAYNLFYEESFHATKRIEACNECAALLIEAEKSFENQAYATAKGHYDKILAVNPGDRHVLTRLGFIQAKEPALFTLVQEEVVESDEPFVIVEHMPSFQGGGNAEFRAWVQKNVVYPAIALENGLQGRVLMEFVVEKDGTVGGVKILTSPDRSLSEAAAKTVLSSPKWTPGKQRGILVRVKFTIPIDFKLQ